MNLNDGITGMHDAGIDVDVFERCTVALMSNHYENVVAIEGGSDGGVTATSWLPLLTIQTLAGGF